MYQELVETATGAATAAAEILRGYFRAGDLDVRTKSSPHDLVSRADHESEAEIVRRIRERFPDHRIMAEEGGRTEGGAEIEWIVDPLDGTSNFLQGLPYVAISLACRQAGQLVAAVVHDPLRRDVFTATLGGGAFWNGRPMRVSSLEGLEGAFLATGYPFNARRALRLYLDIFHDVFMTARGIRRCGAAALDLAYTAAGTYDGFFEFRLSPWDIAAGALLVREAGGKVSDLDGGERFLEGGNVIAGAPGVYLDLLKAVRVHADEARLDEVHPPRNKEMFGVV